jgi:hypothetical protein
MTCERLWTTTLRKREDQILSITVKQCLQLISSNSVLCHLQASLKQTHQSVDLLHHGVRSVFLCKRRKQEWQEITRYVSAANAMTHRWPLSPVVVIIGTMAA